MRKCKCKLAAENGKVRSLAPGEILIINHSSGAHCGIWNWLYLLNVAKYDFAFYGDKAANILLTSYVDIYVTFVTAHLGKAWHVDTITYHFNFKSW